MPASLRSYRVQAHKQTWVCPHGEEVHARKWKFYIPTQDTARLQAYVAFLRLCIIILLLLLVVVVVVVVTSLSSSSPCKMNTGPKYEQLTLMLERMTKEKLNDLYFSPAIDRVIRWGRMKQAEREARKYRW
jgi:hypothetical protein